jgi:hypothetical protein
MRERAKHSVAGGVLALGLVILVACEQGAAATTIEDLRALDKQTLTPLTPEQLAEQRAKEEKAFRKKYEAEQEVIRQRIQEESRRERDHWRIEASMNAIELRFQCERDVDMARWAVQWRDSRRPLVETLKFLRSLGASFRALLLTQRIYENTQMTEKQAADVAEASCLILER